MLFPPIDTFSLTYSQNQAVAGNQVNCDVWDVIAFMWHLFVLSACMLFFPSPWLFWQGVLAAMLAR